MDTNKILEKLDELIIDLKKAITMLTLFLKTLK